MNKILKIINMCVFNILCTSNKDFKYSEINNNSLLECKIYIYNKYKIIEVNNSTDTEKIKKILELHNFLEKNEGYLSAAYKELKAKNADYDIYNWKNFK